MANGRLRMPIRCMPELGRLLQKRDVGATSASPLMVTTSRTRRHVAKVPTAEVILLASEGAVLHHSGSAYRGWLC